MAAKQAGLQHCTHRWAGRTFAFFWFASFLPVSAEPAPLIIRALELFGIGYSGWISSKPSAPRLTVSTKERLAPTSFWAQSREKLAPQPSCTPPAATHAMGTISQGNFSFAQSHGLAAALRSHPSTVLPCNIFTTKRHHDAIQTILQTHLLQAINEQKGT